MGDSLNHPWEYSLLNLDCGTTNWLQLNLSLRSPLYNKSLSIKGSLISPINE